MKTVKTFANLSDAGFASSLLEASGIPALLADEQSYLMQPGNATGGIRLQVQDQDLERAMRVLDQGPDAQVEPKPPGSPEAPEPGGKIPVGIFFAAAVALLVLSFVIYQAKEQRRQARAYPVVQTYEQDYNHTGKPDHFYTYANGKISKIEVDRNGDGKIDEWEYFDSEGRPDRIEYDNNFDGRPDVWYFFKNGTVVRSEEDTDFNGKPDWFGYYENGILLRMDCRPNGSEIVIRRLIYEHAVLREEWVDENHDGKFDYKILIDPFGNRSERIPIVPEN